MSTRPSTGGPGVLPPGPRDDVARGITIMIFTMMVFALQDGITKHLSTEYPVAEILWVRYAGFLLIGLWLERRRPGRAGEGRRLRSRRPVLQLLRGAVLVAEMACFVLSVRYLPLAETHAILSSTPLLVIVLAIPLLGEQVGVRRLSAVAVGFVGVLIILRPGFGFMQPAALIAVLAALLYALFIIVTRMVSRYDSVGVTLAHTGVVGLVVMSIALPFVWQTPDLAGAAFLLTVGCTGTISHWLFFKALEAAPASVLQPFGFTVLVWATLVGYVFFGNIPDRWTVIGALIVVSSGLYAYYRERAVAVAATPAP